MAPYWIYNDQGAKRYFFALTGVGSRRDTTQRKKWPYHTAIPSSDELANVRRSTTFRPTVQRQICWHIDRMGVRADEQGTRVAPSLRRNTQSRGRAFTIRSCTPGSMETQGRNQH